MAVDRVTVYGRGGLKPERGDKNIVEERDVEIPGDEWNRRESARKADAALDQLEQADANWSTLTAAQKDAAQRLAVRVSAKLARLVLGRLEAS